MVDAAAASELENRQYQISAAAEGGEKANGRTAADEMNSRPSGDTGIIGDNEEFRLDESMMLYSSYTYAGMN